MLAQENFIVFVLGTCGNGAGFSLGILVFLCKDYSTDAPYLSLSTYRPVCQEAKNRRSFLKCNDRTGIEECWIEKHLEATKR